MRVILCAAGAPRTPRGNRMRRRSGWSLQTRSRTCPIHLALQPVGAFPERHQPTRLVSVWFVKQSRADVTRWAVSVLGPTGTPNRKRWLGAAVVQIVDARDVDQQVETRTGSLMTTTAASRTIALLPTINRDCCRETRSPLLRDGEPRSASSGGFALCCRRMVMLADSVMRGGKMRAVQARSGAVVCVCPTMGGSSTKAIAWVAGEPCRDETPRRSMVPSR